VATFSSSRVTLNGDELGQNRMPPSVSADPRTEKLERHLTETYIAVRRAARVREG
jgi:hypothetical protein